MSTRGPFSDTYALMMGALAANVVADQYRDEHDRTGETFWRLMHSHLNAMADQHMDERSRCSDNTPGQDVAS